MWESKAQVTSTEKSQSTHVYSNHIFLCQILNGEFNENLKKIFELNYPEIFNNSRFWPKLFGSDNKVNADYPIYLYFSEFSCFRYSLSICTSGPDIQVLYYANITHVYETANLYFTYLCIYTWIYKHELCFE